MAFAEKYSFSIVDDTNGNKKKVEIHQEAYVGSVTALTPAEESEVGRVRGSETDADAIIISSEKVISFIVDGANKTTYDELLAANYQEYLVLVYDDPDSANTLEWQGFVEPGSSQREFNNYKIKYSIVANDGLKTLQDIDYSNDGDIYTGEESGLTIINRCLANLNFTNTWEINLGTFNDQMTSTECALEETTHKNESFSELKDGQYKFDSCWEVIEKILIGYNCRLHSMGEIWKITNHQEYDSYKHVYNSSIVFQSRSAEDLSLDVTNYERVGTGDYTVMLAPKTIRTVFYNKNIGSNEISTNPDFDDGGTPPTGWTNSGWDTFTTTSDGGNNVGETTETTTNTDTKKIEASNFVLSGIVPGTADSIYVTFRVRLKSITFSSSGVRQPTLYAEVEEPGGGVEQGGIVSATEIDGEFVNSEFVFGVTTNGTYKVRLVAEPHPTSPTSQLTYYWDDIFVSHRATINTTTDKYYTHTIPEERRGSRDYELYFGDSVQNSDIGALRVGVDETTGWARYGKSENLEFPVQFSQQKFNDWQNDRKVVTHTFRDTSDLIKPWNVILLDAVYYIIVGYERNHRTTNCTLRMMEINNSDI